MSRIEAPATRWINELTLLTVFGAPPVAACRWHPGCAGDFSYQPTLKPSCRWSLKLGVMPITVAMRILVVSLRHQLQPPLGDATMNAFVEGFLRKASVKAEVQFENIIWVALSSSLGLLVSVAIVAGGIWL
jgi:hypothetical protein